MITQKAVPSLLRVYGTALCPLKELDYDEICTSIIRPVRRIWYSDTLMCEAMISKRNEEDWDKIGESKGDSRVGGIGESRVGQGRIEDLGGSVGRWAGM